jgi:hypothetical protein
MTKTSMIPFHHGTLQDPYQASDIFMYEAKHDIDAFKEAAIPVENITCPLLIISGEADSMWPSYIYGNLIMQRLEEKGSRIKRKHVHYKDAGHEIGFPYIPSITKPFNMSTFYLTYGGSAEGNAHANQESWHEILNFLDKI